FAVVLSAAVSNAFCQSNSVSSEDSLATEVTEQKFLPDTNYVYRSLAAALADSDHVYRLNLSRKKLKAFPAEIFRLKNLQDLDLSHNKIDSIPKEISSLTQLQRLNLSS